MRGQRAAFSAPEIHRLIREWSPARLNTTVFSHGHIDHVFGVGEFEREARERGGAPPRVIAHERYKLTAGYNVSNQAGAPGGCHR